MIDRTPPRPTLLLSGLLLLLLAPLFVPIPVALQQHPYISPLADRIHVALFGGLVLLLHRWGPLRGRRLLVIAAVVALGGLSELVQSLVGRSASVWDWFQDIQGVALAACWLWWRRGRRRALPVLAAVAVVVSVLWPLRDLPVVARESTAIQRQFPLLSDFERPDSGVLWSGYEGGEAQVVPREDGGHALRLATVGRERWPGAVSRRLAWHWTGQDTLLVDARLVAPSPDTVQVSVWLEDRRTGRDKDYAIQTSPLSHRWTTLRVPLHDLRTRRRGRPLALQTIQAIAVFMHRRDDEPLSMEIDNVRLKAGG
ncbi:MAG: hypothetical protein R3D98_00720 [Candidatus Krumholzibacteriia bacterium]